MGRDTHRTSYGTACTTWLLAEATFQQSCPEVCKSEAQTKPAPQFLPASDLSFEHDPLVFGQTDLKHKQQHPCN